MILPVFALGQPVLKRVAMDISADYPELEKLLADMWQTMYHAEGVGLAAPQIGLGIRLFVVDTDQIEYEEKDVKPTDPGIKMVFINARILEESGKMITIEEGCLSIPKIRGDVERRDVIRISWLDEKFQPHEATFSEINARVIQHEYDHIQGILFTDRLKPLRKRLIQRKLESIKMGKIQSDYKMKFFNVR
jgi:peptide deformylase